MSKFPMAIAEFVPHTETACLLDEVLAWQDGEIVTGVTLDQQARFATTQGVPSWVGIEYMAQAISAYAGIHAHMSSEPLRIGLLLGSRKYEAHCNYFPFNTALRVAARSSWDDGDGIGAFECWIETDHERLAEAQIKAWQPANIDDYLEML